MTSIIPQRYPTAWPEWHGRPWLGANGTAAMQTLLAQGGGHLVDYLKVGPFMGREVVASLASRYPLLLHLDDTLSRQHLPQEDIDRLCDWATLTGTPWTSEHIGFGVANVNLDEALITQPATDLLSREEALDHIVRNARELARQLPVPLLLENVPLFPNFAHITVCEPEFISEVIAATGCDLLLDLAHARVSADVLGYEVRDYISRLPIERTVEFHLSSPRPCRALEPGRQAIVRENARSIAHIQPFGDDNLVDAHQVMQAGDYALLEWVLSRVEPRAISLEYYYEPAPLSEQLERLRALLGRA